MTAPGPASGPRPLVDDAAGRIGGLIRLATQSDDVAAVIAAAWSHLHRPIAVVDRSGNPVARMPAGAQGREASAAALRAARPSNAEREPGRWLVLPLEVGQEPLGHLAVLTEPELSEADTALLDVFSSLVADQLNRLSLATAVVDERARAFKRRLISDGAFARSTARRAAVVAGVALAAEYWPAMLVSEREPLTPNLASAIEDLATRYSPDSLVVELDERATVLLLASDETDTRRLEDVQVAVERILSFLRKRSPSLGGQGLVADAPVPVAEIPASVRSLDRLRRYPRRERDTVAVLTARHFALNRLLEGVDRQRAVDFVQTYVGALASYDRAHDSHLCETLEAALDYPNRDEAARAAYMHRNTFRRHLNQAMKVVGVDLHDPEERLALHVALKLRSQLRIGRPRDVHGPVKGGSRPAPAHGG